VTDPGSHIPPKEFRNKQFVFPSATITPTVVIFADKSFAGDERDARWVLERRASRN
jgi:hypothetical protein